jgi:hypothetical protein
MPEQCKDSIYQKQKNVRPKIEDNLGDILEGERLKHALEFITYLRANKMSPAWASENSWKAPNHADRRADNDNRIVLRSK